MVHKGVYIKVYTLMYMSSNCPVYGFIQKIDSKISVLLYV